MNGSGVPKGGSGGPLVWCDDCGFQWHGSISAHGLRVIGQCPRCQGTLGFRDERASIARVEDDTAARDAVQPWQVLGTPSSWTR